MGRACVTKEKGVRKASFFCCLKSTERISFTEAFSFFRFRSCRRKLFSVSVQAKASRIRPVSLSCCCFLSLERAAMLFRKERKIRVTMGIHRMENRKRIQFTVHR